MVTVFRELKDKDYQVQEEFINQGIISPVVFSKIQVSVEKLLGD